MKEGNRTIRWMTWLLVLFLPFLAMLYFYYDYPHQAIGPRQPVSFSHRVHAGVKEINCRFCHPYVDRSKIPGIPPVGQCFFCHLYIIPQHPEIMKEKSYYVTQTPVPWVKVHMLPDYVKFNHQPHIQSKIDCRVCHGDVAAYDRLLPIQFKMGFCVDCHRLKKAQLDCWLACHR